MGRRIRILRELDTDVSITNPDNINQTSLQTNMQNLISTTGSVSSGQVQAAANAIATLNVLATINRSVKDDLL